MNSDKLTSMQKKLILVAGIGGMLEFYDFIIYAMLVGYIAQIFFPVKNHLLSIAITFATFSVGYLVRPIGGIVFGHFGDKYGRKKTFTLSIIMMAGTTFCLGLVPSFASIGIMAPIIVLSLRLLQGFSVGGQIPGALTYIYESVPRSPGFACAAIFSFLINGITLGAIVNALLTSALSNASILSWGWRIPFFIGGIVGAIGYVLRNSFYESKEFTATTNDRVKIPFIEVIKTHTAEAIRGSLIIGFGASIVCLMYLFTPTYLTNIVHYQSKLVNWSITFALFFASILAVLFGWLADFVTRKKLLIFTSIIVGLSAYPVFYIFTKQIINPIWPLMYISIFTGLFWGVAPVELAKLFDVKIRYSGIGLAYNIGFAVFGGLTPVIAVMLIQETNSLLSPSYYLIATAIFSLLAILL